MARGRSATGETLYLESVLCMGATRMLASLPGLGALVVPCACARHIRERRHLKSTHAPRIGTRGWGRMAQRQRWRRTSLSRARNCCWSEGPSVGCVNGRFASTSDSCLRRVVEPGGSLCDRSALSLAQGGLSLSPSLSVAHFLAPDLTPPR